MSRPNRYWAELAAKAVREQPELISQLEQGAPLLDALDALQLNRRLAAELGEHPAVRAALARRRAALRAQLGDADKGKREAAEFELATYHGVRKPGSKTVEERFQTALERFRTAEPTAYAKFYDILVDMGEISHA